MADAQRQRGGIPFGPTSLIATADWTATRLSALGIRLPSGNRLQRAKALIEDVQAGNVVLTPEDDAVLERVTESQWTIVEQYLATRMAGLPTRPAAGRLREKLEQMLSGAESPDQDRNSLARDIQFELFIAAMFAMGDVPAWLAEPDLVFEYSGQVFGIAAKRVQSFRNAPKRAEDAAKQLAAAHLEGVVAVNVDLLLKKTGGTTGPEATLAERLEVVDEIESRMARHEHVLATMTFGRDCTWEFSGPRPHADPSSYFRFTVHPRRDQDEDLWRRFFDALMTRMEERLESL